MDLSKTIAPQSEQQNYDDYTAGPRTVTVERVTAGSDEQPVCIHLVEYPRHPYKPSKSMRRVLVAAWGPESSIYLGRRMTLAGDPTIRYGGIVITHLSHIDRRLTLMLTRARGKKEAYAVDPLPNVAPPAVPPKATTTPDPATMEQLTALNAAMVGLGIEDQESKLSWLGGMVGRTLTSSRDVTGIEADQVLATLAVDTETP